MRTADYLRLGFSGVKAHKKRALMVVIIGGLLLGVAMVLVLLLQGIENSVFMTILAPTDGKVLMMSSIDAEYFEDDYDTNEEVAKIKESIEKHGGEIISAKIIENAGEAFYHLESDVFSSLLKETSTLQVLVPLKSVIGNLNLSVSGNDFVSYVEDGIEKVEGETFTNAGAISYQVAGLLPGKMITENLSFRSIGQSENLLNVFFGQIETGDSENFIVGEIAGGENVEEIGLVFSEFPSVKAADEYFSEATNFCENYRRANKSCGRDYRYYVRPAISEPTSAYEKFQNISSAINAFAIILTVVAGTITLMTYVRLVEKDKKILALYRTMGATKLQIKLVYLVYFAILSSMMLLFALGLSTLCVAIISLINQGALSQVFTLGFNVKVGFIWLMGWNTLLTGVCGVSFLPVFVTFLVRNKSK